MRNYFIMAALFSLAFGTSYAKEPVKVVLWPNGVPESNGLTGEEIIKNDNISNVSNPGMTVYFADSAKNTGAAVLICPGGGYSGQAARHEGTQIAQWLNENGITGIVLKYRLPNRHSYIPLKDAQQAMRIIRSRAAEWGINPGKVGISGFSAGGHLASTAGTHFDLGTPFVPQPIKATKKNKKIVAPQPIPVSTYSCRPDFMILFYPVVTMHEATHGGTRNNLLGENYSKDSANYYSNEMQVTKDTPPTLLLLSDDDKAVPPINSVNFYAALKANNVSASMYIFPKGGHGWGYHENFEYHEIWKSLCLDWLKFQKIIE